MKKQDSREKIFKDLMIEFEDKIKKQTGFDITILCSRDPETHEIQTMVKGDWGVLAANHFRLGHMIAKEMETQND